MEPAFKLEIFVPEGYFDPVRRALWQVDAGHIGMYDRCLSWSYVHSSWRPLAGATPFDGTVGTVQQAQEIKIEVCCLKSRLQETLDAVRGAHPYEETVINVIPLYSTGLNQAEPGRDTNGH